MKLLLDDYRDDRVAVAGNCIYPGYVVAGTERTLMIDCGLNILGPRYIKSLGDILGPGRILDYLFLTHSHYDHLGAAPCLKRRIPALRIGGHEKIEFLMAKESVIRRMTELGDIQRPLFPGLEDDDTSLGPIRLDLKLKDGDVIDLGGIRCEVYASPGHTADSLAYFFPDIRALFPGEAIGVPEGRDGAGVQVEFLSSVNEYVETIRRLRDLKPDKIFMAHAWVFTGEDARDFFSRSLEETGKYCALIERYLEGADGNVSKAVETMARVEYDEKGTIFQPFKFLKGAFLPAA